jgi:hypothetical protein
MAVEEPKYRVVLQEFPYEVRQYESTLIAETHVQGSLGEASNKGFRILADFIFGNNRAAAGETPQKIAMTAPVTVDSDQTSKAWRVQFTMPASYNLNTLPKPNNPAVAIRALPTKTYAVIVFSGLAGEQKTLEKTRQLNLWCQSRNLQVVGLAQLARYNPPWTLPPWRRNEIMIELVAMPK